MIISSEHHDLLMQFMAATKEQAAAIDVLLAHLNIPNHDRNIAIQLSNKMEEASNKVAILHKQLQDVSLDSSTGDIIV